MASDSALASTRAPSEQIVAEPTKLPRYWPAVVMLTAYWAFELTCRRMELSMFVLFISRFAVLALLFLSFTIWWLTNRRIARRDRWLTVAVAIVGAGAAVAVPLTPSALGPLIFLGIPWAFTLGTLWLIVSKTAAPRVRRWGLWATIWLVWGFCTLVCDNGLSGDQQAQRRWRWQPTAEELFLAERVRAGSDAPGDVGATVELAAGDWPDFRGPRRDGRVEERELALDWKTSPPRQVWTKRVGPSWSSAIVVGGRLFTQEQRGDAEAVVCYEAASGRELWAHEDAARFDESVSGAGPRATPTFAGGRIYAVGARGKLNCLEAANGRAIWSRDLVAESGATVPQWGFSSSPLVVEGLVVAFAGGPQDHGLLAYRAATGEPAWSVATGKTSYSSPQLASLGGVTQILFLSDRGLIGIEPSRGVVLWEHSLSTGQALPQIQPHIVGDTGVVFQSGDQLSLVEVRRQEGVWSVEQRWSSRSLRPSFNDVVIHGDAIYGFDEGIFCCVDLRSGERRWKGGRYGHGQVLLLVERSLLLVGAENGEMILLSANPDQAEELARIRAIKGKTWNHPVIAHGRLFVRNDEEMVCYDLGGSAYDADW